MNPVCQDPGANIYAMYKGRLCPLVPVVNEHDTTEILCWVHSPTFTSVVDAELEEKEKKRMWEERKRMPTGNRTSPYDDPDGDRADESGTDGPDVDMSDAGL